jgi:hypothetical protein
LVIINKLYYDARPTKYQDLSSLLAAFLHILESKINCDTVKLSMPVEARRAIYDFSMEEDHSNQKITNHLDLFF